MKSGLETGSRGRHSLEVGAQHTVPNLYPESEKFAAMPAVFATGYMVGLMEWACIEHLSPFLDEGEGSLGTHVDVSHIAATPPGLTVTVDTEVESVDGKSVWFKVSAHDGQDLIGEGRHRRAVVTWDRFVPRAMAKADAASGINA